jgi:hypothetical protein
MQRNILDGVLKEFRGRPKTLILETGRTMGLEPTNGGITIHCLNHLATLAVQHISTLILG